jgi:two-component system, NarL family, nitrate/nitrite response regulator NarL
MLNIPGITTSGHLLPPQAADAVRVVIAGSDPLARASLSTILEALDDISVVDDMDLDEQLAARLRVLAPDVLVCDGEPDGLAPNLASEVPLLVLLNGHGSANALAAGARGVLARTATAARMQAAIRALREGLVVLDVESARDLPRNREALPMAEPFTARELEVVQLLAAGLTNKEIAQRLGITEHTVKFHVNAILGKLGAATRTEAVVHAARLGIVVL